MAKRGREEHDMIVLARRAEYYRVSGDNNCMQAITAARKLRALSAPARQKSYLSRR